MAPNSLPTWRQFKRHAEKVYFAAMMEAHGNNVAAVARAAGCNRTHVYRHLGRHGVARERQPGDLLTAEQRDLQRWLVGANG